MSAVQQSLRSFNICLLSVKRVVESCRSDVKELVESTENWNEAMRMYEERRRNPEPQREQWNNSSFTKGNE